MTLVYTRSCRHALTTATLCLPSLRKPPTTDKLQRVLNAAARVVTGTRKYDRGLTEILRNELHWLSVPQRVKFKLGSQHHVVPLPSSFSSAVPVRLLHAGRECRRS